MSSNLVTAIRQSVLAVKAQPQRSDVAYMFPLYLASEAADEIERLRAALLKADELVISLRQSNKHRVADVRRVLKTAAKSTEHVS